MYLPKSIPLPTLLVLCQQTLSALPRSLRGALSAALGCLRCVAKARRWLVRAAGLVPSLLRLLEGVAARRTFRGAPLFRGLCAPAWAEGHAAALDGLEAEAFGTLMALLSIDCDGGEDGGPRLLTWSLLCANVVLGGGQAPAALPPLEGGGDWDEGDRGLRAEGGGERARVEDVGGLRSALRWMAAREGLGVPPTHWQVKRSCVQLLRATLLLSRKRACPHGAAAPDPLGPCPSPFSPELCAAAAAAALPRAASLLAGGPGSLEPVPAGPGLLADELVAAACSAASACSEDSELGGLQLEGLRLLRELLVCFAGAHDPAEYRSTGVPQPLLKRYFSQLASALRPALAPAAAPRLAAAACDAAAALVGLGLATDASAARRLARLLAAPPAEGGAPWAAEHAAAGGRLARGSARSRCCWPSAAAPRSARRTRRSASRGGAACPSRGARRPPVRCGRRCGGAATRSRGSCSRP